MNILICLSQTELTGAEVYAINWANEIIKNKNKVIIASDLLHKQTDAIFEKVPLTNRTIKGRIKNIGLIIQIIKKYKIDIVCSNSRASAWIANLACKITKVPHVVFAHGRQATFLSRKITKAFGDLTIGVCENINKQIIKEFNIPENKLKIVRNGFYPVKNKDFIPADKKRLLIVSRLTGPKGEMIIDLLEFFDKNKNRLPDIDIVIAGAIPNPEKIIHLKNKYNFLGFINNLEEEYLKADIILGSGRSAIEGILYQKQTIVIGEACTIGLVKNTNLHLAMETNFGDMDEKEKQFDFELILNDINYACINTTLSEEVYKKINFEYSIYNQVERIENYLKSLIVRYQRKMIPILCYHRVLDEVPQAIKNGIYVTSKQFEIHLKYLKDNGYKSISTDELIQNNITTDKRIMITFDDGYEDNYTIAFPLLKKYGFGAVIFLVTNSDSNKWDESKGEVEAKMMSSTQVKEMYEYGIEFGNHTSIHSNLTAIDIKGAIEEIKKSKLEFKDKYNFEPETFAYPYGNYNEEIKQEVKKEGYKIAFATDKAALATHEDLFAIRRILIFPNTNLAGFIRKINPKYLFRKVDKKLIENIPDNWS